ncbi:DNA (cytosine-5)-methyltransferase DRM2-like [Impatiens glandulifera]|uniref:DNA (cytosine-5)-methyltransferase DRM2-like n=1 Tax=Impatiens glandulifera TaxID=253017 RepID=UPI001FB163D4|nr:DNA (cytosine-5)-methyltransferase DRM2-like [Impatiens glandulifera]
MPEPVQMNGNVAGEESDSIDWDTEDELEIENIPMSNSIVTNTSNGALPTFGEASSSRDPALSNLIDHFVGMGFSLKMVLKSIEDNGEANMESILESLLTYTVLADSPEEAYTHQQQQQQQPIDTNLSSSDYEENVVDEQSDTDSFSEYEDEFLSSSDSERTLKTLGKMGYSLDEAKIAMERCGPNAKILELTDFICAAQICKKEDVHYELLQEEKPKVVLNGKRKHLTGNSHKIKKPRGGERVLTEEDEPIRLPKPMIGFGVPNDPRPWFKRTLPEAAVGPPYFYYENVALAPKGVWDTIKRFLYEVEPEFVDSKYFCAAARKRGYIHNLPIENRFPLLPLPPRTIHEAFPLTRRWWPSWDDRTTLNCLQTCIASAKLTEKIRKSLEDNRNCDPPLHVQKSVLEECRKWNLVWVGHNKVAPLEPDEVEMLLGFPRNHTRGGISRTDRYKSLGNSFQVDTVAYHLSVLKDLYPQGMNVLSLFSGIGGGEVALHRLGIPLKNVVSIDISEGNRNVVKSWWGQTNQKGKLIHFPDVQDVDGEKLENLRDTIGDFDLVIGGSPCNNLAGSNRHSRDGLEGEQSSLFFDYFRILDLVKTINGRHQ